VLADKGAFTLTHSQTNGASLVFLTFTEFLPQGRDGKTRGEI